ncbi:MAG: cobalamin-dependent protein [Candidatus Adiutrix sp.]|jgi:5-methyltetrahydrofolate--homocysteine methyltransferase|nr:cobalamin-dependent protein [Candidatus Adiutrix sp.]
MTDGITLAALNAALVSLDDVAGVETARRLLECGVAPIEIMTACEKSLTEIGEKYARGEYFIAGLIMAGDLMSRIIELVTPRLVAGAETNSARGRVLIGTVQGDIHGLGKNIAGALLSAYGFSVRDLGVDVVCEDFVRECREFKPDIVGLSVLLSTCYPHLAETIRALRELRGQKEKPAIFISGAQVTPQTKERYGADYYAETAFDTVHLCQKLAGCDPPPPA